MRAVVIFMFTILFSGEVYALEPVSALDDGFAVPSDCYLTEAALSYPGSESWIKGVFVSGSWIVPYGIEDLAITTFLTGVNMGIVSLSVSYSGSGFDLYGEEQEKLGISYAPLTWFSAGLRITRNAIRIKGYGNASAWSSDVGVVFKPHDTVYIAGAIEDITGAELGESSEPLDGHVRYAASWKTTGDITLLLSVTKVRRFNSSLSAGFSAELLDVLTIGVIGANEPDRLEFLCGVQVKGTVFSYRGTYHRDLDMSHGFSINWGVDSLSHK